MTTVVDHLAELTAFRDRDALDATLVGALKDLLQPLAVAIYRRVGEPGAERWLTRARLGPGDLTPHADPLFADLETLPALGAHPLRAACLHEQRTVLAPPAAQGGGVLACFPLGGEGDAAGVLELVTAAPLGDEQQRLVASILRIYRNFHGLLDYSERDTLTGLLNRKTFDESFLRVALGTQLDAAAVAVDQRRPRVVGGPWLGVVDIDHFKRVNDTHGHLIGDEVLLLLSRLMRSSFRHHDRLYRFGGEEFVVLMRCGSAADAAVAFERLRHNVEQYAFPRVGRITVSIGFTQVRPGDTPAGAFERADQAVYHVKQNGRNQVADHAALVASGALADATRDSDVELF
ncbi:MAG: GGDEF domain-containing protein [Rubrivivax sp.]|nr:GGDEF domain-containing protein [Rubrivivax sp.]